MSIILDADLQRRILQQVETGRFHSPSQVVEEGMDLLEGLATAKIPLQEQPIHDDPPIWDTIVALGESLPPEAWANVPTDLSKNLDHYLYGSPKVEE